MATRSTAGAKPQGIAPLTKRESWKALQAHYEKVRELHLRGLFAEDAKRGERMTAEAVGIFLDYSKNRITQRNPQAPPPAGRGIRPALANRRHVSRRQN